MKMAKQNNYKITKKGLQVEVGDNFATALRKFKQKVDESGILQDYLKREYYEKPTTKRKREAGAAKARWKRKVLKDQLPPRRNN